MMALEKKLAETDLSKYENYTKDKFAQQICIYRNFKTNEALKRFDGWKKLYSKSTAKWYFDESMRYLNKGVCLLPQSFIKYLENYKDCSCYTPESPQFARGKGIKGRKSMKIEVPVTRRKAVQSTVIEKFVYGIRFNGCCMITFANEKEQEMFLKGMEMASVIKDYKKIHVKSDAITEVE